MSQPGCAAPLAPIPAIPSALIRFAPAAAPAVTNPSGIATIESEHAIAPHVPAP